MNFIITQRDIDDRKLSEYKVFQSSYLVSKLDILRVNVQIMSNIKYTVYIILNSLN